jgi:hypothetical protein
MSALRYFVKINELRSAVTNGAIGDKLHLARRHDELDSVFAVLELHLKCSESGFAKIVQPPMALNRGMDVVRPHSRCQPAVVVTPKDRPQQRHRLIDTVLSLSVEPKRLVQPGEFGWAVLERIVDASEIDQPADPALPGWSNAQ